MKKRGSEILSTKSEIISKSKIQSLICQTLVEDIGSGDITSNAIIPKEQKAMGVIIAKEPGVIAGLSVAKEVFRQVDGRIKFSANVKDGTKVAKGTVIATVAGPARGILAGERTALNFLQQLSGIATLTRQFMLRATSHERRVTILDTRKTTPGMRILEKQAVKAGGGENHRMGLWDAVLIKDNHIKLGRGVKRAVEGIRRWEKVNEGKGRGRGAIEVEAKTITQVKQAIECRVDKILLDNMSLKTLRRAVKLCRKAGIKTEASGGVNLGNVRAIARTGVDYISVGALTHSARALDLSLKII